MDNEFLQLKKDDAIKAFNSGTESDRRLLTNLYGKAIFHRDPLEWVTSMADVYEATGVRQSDYEAQPGATPEQINRKAYKTLCLIYALFNGAWKPNYADKNQAKYYPFFEYDSRTNGFVLDDVDAYYVNTDVGSRLCTRNEKTVRHICKHFLPQYNAYLLS